MFDMSSLVNTDWNCQFSIRALSVAKVFEKVIVALLKKILQPKISKLQRGFCEHSSSANTAFLLSEAIAEAKDADEPLYAAYLDASNAFDVVWHAGMLACCQVSSG